MYCNSKNKCNKNQRRKACQEINVLCENSKFASNYKFLNLKLSVSLQILFDVWSHLFLPLQYLQRVVWPCVMCARVVYCERAAIFSDLDCTYSRFGSLYVRQGLIFDFVSSHCDCNLCEFWPSKRGKLPVLNRDQMY